MGLRKRWTAVAAWSSACVGFQRKPAVWKRAAAGIALVEETDSRDRPHGAARDYVYPLVDKAEPDHREL